MKLRNEKIIGSELLFDNENRLVPQEISKSLLAALYMKSINSFRKEIYRLMEELLHKKTEDFSEKSNSYKILAENENRKTYSRNVCEILFHYFGNIYYDEINQIYSRIKSKYHGNIRKRLRKGRTRPPITSGNVEKHHQ